MKKYLLIFTTLNFFFRAGAQSWNITGNAGTNPAVHFLGTSDNKPLRFRVNNRFAGEIDSVTGKTFLGYGAGKNITTGSGNTAIGYKSLNSNTIGSINTAIGIGALSSNISGNYNTAVGYAALFNNTISKIYIYDFYGSRNTAIGSNALYSNTIGYNNTATGDNALHTNTNGSDNTATGSEALRSNTTGGDNTATGAGALRSNTTGVGNTAYGKYALSFNQFGSYNTGIGGGALVRTINSRYNTAVGSGSAIGFDMGWNNTLVGANSDGSFDGQYNIVAIGQGVTCPDNSTARIGNSATWSIGGFAGWSNFSDSRFKKDIKENVKGIDFIKKLRPVTYHLNIQGLSKQLKENNGEEWDKQMKTAITEKEKKVYTGFVAQEVEKAAEETGFDFSGVDKPRRADGYYGLRYAEFVVPLVKAVQEQQAEIEELKKQNTGLLDRITALENKLGNNSVNTKTNVLSIRPNPSQDMVSINIVSAKASRAFIKIVDSKGALVKQKQADIVQGNNRFDVDIKELAGGTYLVSAEWNNGGVNKTIVLVKQ
jgi:trimeric autotransporter adhesin